MAELKKVALNRVVAKQDQLTITKKEFLVGMGVSSAVADKLIGLETQGKWCIVDASCDNCVHNIGKNGISVSAVKELLDSGKLKSSDLNVAVLEKIRK